MYCCDARNESSYWRLFLKKHRVLVVIGTRLKTKYLGSVTPVKDETASAAAI
jgi:hypothetical protein